MSSLHFKKKAKRKSCEESDLTDLQAQMNKSRRIIKLKHSDAFKFKLTKIKQCDNQGIKYNQKIESKGEVKGVDKNDRVVKENDVKKDNGAESIEIDEKQVRNEEVEIEKKKPEGLSVCDQKADGNEEGDKKHSETTVKPLDQYKEQPNKPNPAQNRTQSTNPKPYCTREKKIDKLVFMDRYNRNQEIEVRNHELIYKYSKNSHFVNPYDTHHKDSFDFEKIKEFIPDNEAVTLQKNYLDYENKKLSHHTVKVKTVQSACSVKRIFGISYIKENESKQKGVSDYFKPLPALVIQCSNNCNYQKELVSLCEMSIEKDFCFGKGKGEFLFSYYQGKDEIAIRNYLDYRKGKERLQNLELMVVKAESIEQILPFTYNNDCIVLHGNITKTGKFKSLGHEHANSPDLVIQSDLSIVIFTKKSLNSKKKFISSINQTYKTAFKADEFIKLKRKPSKQAEELVDGVEEDKKNGLVDEDRKKVIKEYLRFVLGSNTSINTDTTSYKYEGYVKENVWRRMSKKQKDTLFTYICVLKEKLELFFKDTGIREYLAYEKKGIDAKTIELIYKTNSSEKFTAVTLKHSKLAVKPKIGRFPFQNLSLLPLRLTKKLKPFNLINYFVDTRDCFVYDPISLFFGCRGV